MKKYMQSTATVPGANAVGIPENITTSVTMVKSNPSDNTLTKRASH